MRPHQLVPVPSFVISSPERDLGRKAIETHVFALVGLRIIPVERPERDLGRKAIETSTPGCTVRVPDNVVPKGTLAERLLRLEQTAQNGLVGGEVSRKGPWPKGY